MRKILILAVFAVSIFIVSCGGGKSNPTAGDRDETDSVSDASDPTDDSGDTNDTTSDDIDDTTSDDSDSGDSTDDSDQGGQSGDSDAGQNPCDPNPCTDDPNSTHECTPRGRTTYFCDCKEGYYWWGKELGCMSKRPVTIGNICTGQNKCYDYNNEIVCPTSPTADLYGQDAWYASLGYCTPHSFTVQTVSSQNIVVDNNTGLMWQQKAVESEEHTWEEAVSYCDNLAYAGYYDWRLPTPQELLTIVDSSRIDPAADTTYFPGIPDHSFFWSSYPNAVNPDKVWGVNFNGEIYSSSRTNNISYARCVRGDKLPTAAFKRLNISGDLVAVDFVTGLMWQDDIEGFYSWEDALKYCEDLVYAGFSDWRLPNKNEVVSLANYENTYPSSDFPGGIQPFNFWSSTPCVYHVYDSYPIAWYMKGIDGDVDTYNKSGHGSARCVRNAE